MAQDVTTHLLGAHVSSAGGTHNAPPRANAIGGTTMQLFTKQANQWRERECEEVEITAFIAAMEISGVSAVSSHDSYLINLASPKEDLRAKSLESFMAELRRCDALGIHFLVSHPGNYMDERESGVGRNADAIAEALERVPGTVRLLLETTAGSGTALGATFEELREIIDRVPAEQRTRIGVCLDTCHVYAAGYDLVADYDGVMQHFDDTIGLNCLGVMHLNDSKHPMGSHKDRHELIADGALGESPFRRIMTDDRLATVPKVLETPKLDDAEATDRRMLALLRSYADE
ncbi:MAG: deoxyribonuclease IV [Gemmatimonadaceae bacterium]